MASTTSREMPVGGSQRPFLVTAALFGLTMFIIYLLVLIPQTLLLQLEEATLAEKERRADNTQKRTEPTNEYKYLNDTNCRLQIPLFNMPFLYKVRFKLFMPWKNTIDFGTLNWTSRGYVVMFFAVRKTNSRLQMHVLNLDIREVYIQDDMNRNITITQVSQIYSQVLDVHTAVELIENMNYSAHIHFTGQIVHSKNYGGLQAAPYKEHDEIKYTVYTHAQTQDARAILPCIDVPEAKAKFLVSITHPIETAAVANGPEISRRHEGEWITTKFDESPHMSTYLFAIAVSEFPFIETSYKDIRIRLYAEKLKIHDAYLALNAVPKVLKMLEDYFMIPAPLTKLDFFETPHLKVHAMENWGLITSQPDGLIYNKNHSDASERQLVLATIAHEVVHQWFGNLVTMRWWNNLWLNEGFATYISIKMVEQMGENQVVDNMQMLKMAMNMRVEMSTPKVISKPEFPTFPPANMFETAYVKPAWIIKMVEQIVGEEAFRLGIIRFLRHFSYANADHNDLMEALTYAYDSTSGTRFDGQNFTLTELIESWIYQAGYPAVILESGKRGKINAWQMPTYNGNSVQLLNQRWIIPIFIRDSITREKKTVWLKGNETVELDIGNEIIVDPDTNILMRVLYDASLYSKIIKSLNENHTVILMHSKARLVDDAFTWAENELIAYGVPFNICTFLRNETMYVPFGMFSAHLDMFFSRLNVIPEYSLLKKYIATVLSPAYFRIQKVEQHLRSSNEQLIYEISCKRLCWAGFLPCVTEARMVFERLKESCGYQLLSSSCNTIPKSLRKCIYGTAVMFGEQEAFDYLYDRYQAEKNLYERMKLWTGLVASQRYDDIEKAWNDFLFVQLRWYSAKQFQELCADYSKYYHPNLNFLEYSLVTQDKIIKTLSFMDMEVYIMLLARTLTQLDQRSKFNSFVDAALQKFPKLRNNHSQFSRVLVAVSFRKDFAPFIFNNLTDILEKYDDQPFIAQQVQAVTD